VKRYNLLQARGAEFSFGTEGIVIEGEGNDVIELNVKRGTVDIIVPVTQPDGAVSEECFRQHSYLDIELEDGTHITGSVRNGEAHLEAASPGRRVSRPAAKAPTRRRGKQTLTRHKVLSKGSALE